MVQPKAVMHREKRSLEYFDLVARALTHRILPKGLIKNNDELANHTAPAYSPLSIQLILASHNVVYIKEAIQHKRDTEVSNTLEKEIIENIAYIMQATETSYDPFWHPADILLILLLATLVVIGALGLIFQHQTITVILSKKPLTKGRDMKTFRVQSTSWTFSLNPSLICTVASTNCHFAFQTLLISVINSPD